jgi:HEAT repeat protein
MSEGDQILTDLSSDSIDVRKQAAFNAGEKKIEAAVPKLIHLLATDPDNVVRNTAARSLGKIADPAQKEIILDALCKAVKDKDYYTKVNACWSLGKLKDTKAVPCLSTMIDPSQHIYMSTGDGKTETQQAPATAELKEMGVQYSDVIIKAINALGDIGSPEGNPALLLALKDEQDGTVRCAAALALAAIGSSEVVEPLLEAIKDKYWYVRRDIAKALKVFKDPRSIKPLAELLNDMYDQVKKNALDTLLAIGKPAAKELLIAFFNHPDNADLQKFLRSLTKEELIAIIDGLIHKEGNPQKKEQYMKYLAAINQQQ